MPQRRPLSELSEEGMKDVLDFQKAFIPLYKRYIELTERKKSFSPRNMSYGSSETANLDMGRVFEDILRTSNKKGDSFVKVYRIMVKTNSSIQRALDIADPKDQVDKRTLQRYIDEAYIKMARQYQAESNDGLFPITDAIDFEATITDYVDDEIVVNCTVHQRIDKLTWTYESTRSYLCFSYKEKQSLSFNEAFWKIEKKGALRELSFGSQACWRFIKHQIEDILDTFPYLRSYPDLYEKFFYESEGELHFSNALFEAVENGEKGFFAKFSPGTDNGSFIKLNFPEVEVLPAEETHILQSQDLFIQRLNSLKMKGNFNFEEFKKFRMAYSGTINKYFKDFKQLVEETGDIEKASEVNEIAYLIYEAAYAVLIPVDIILFLFVQFFGPNDIDKGDAWQYPVYLKAYISQMYDRLSSK